MATKKAKAIRKHITFNAKTYGVLEDYIRETYGEGHRLLSAIVDEATKDFLKKEGKWKQ